MPPAISHGSTSTTLPFQRLQAGSTGLPSSRRPRLYRLTPTRERSRPALTGPRRRRSVYRSAASLRRSLRLAATATSLPRPPVSLARPPAAVAPRETTSGLLSPAATPRFRFRRRLTTTPSDARRQSRHSTSSTHVDLSWICRTTAFASECPRLLQNSLPVYLRQTDISFERFRLLKTFLFVC